MRHKSVCAAAVSALFCLPATTGPSDAGTLFSALAGSWSGGGTVRLAGGKREKLKCRAYYRAKGTSGLGIAIRCANPSNKIHLRGSLRQGGSVVTGTWEERSFNAEGSLSGTATASTLRLSIRGSVSGSLFISLQGNKNIVTMSAGENGVNLRFSRL